MIFPRLMPPAVATFCASLSNLPAWKNSSIGAAGCAGQGSGSGQKCEREAEHEAILQEGPGVQCGVRTSILFLALTACAATPPARFKAHVIAEDLQGGYQVVPADLNHDGKPDLIALASGITDLVWFENPGWQRHVIASGLKQMINLAVVDTGEIVLAHGFSSEAKNSTGIVSVLTPGPDPKQPWSIREIDRLPTSHRLRTANFDGTGQVVVNAPLTGALATPPDYRGHTPLVFLPPRSLEARADRRGKRRRRARALDHGLGRRRPR